MALSGSHGAGAPVLPDGHVARGRLVRRLAEHRIVVVHANGGWGKSTLAAEAAARHTGEVTWIDLRDVDLDHRGVLQRLLDPLGMDGLAGEDRDDDTVAAGIERVMARRRPAALVVVDEVGPQHWSAVRLLGRALPDPHRLVVLGRRVPEGDGGQTTDGRWPRLTTTDLAFTTEELHLLLVERLPGGLPDVMVEQLRLATGGWSTALRAVVNALGRSAAPHELGRRLLGDNVVLDVLVHDLLAPLDDDARRRLGAAACLPLLDARLARDLGLADTIRAAAEAGVPWETPAVGPWTLPDPVADLLRPDDPLPLPELRPLAVGLARHGRVLEGARLAVEHHHPDLAARIVADASIDDLRESFKPSLLAFLRALPDDVVARHPRVDVQVARLLTLMAAYGDRNAHVLARAPRWEASHPDVAAAMHAERYRDLAYFSPTPDPADITAIEDLLASTVDLETRCRLEQGLALLLARRDGVDAAEAGLRRAAETAERAGDRHQAALILRDLAWVVLLEQGRLRQVVATFDRVEAMLGPGTTTTAWRINRADTLVMLGELEAADRDLDIAARQAELQHDDQHVAYAAWARAGLESMRGERLRTLAAVQRAEQLAGDWMQTVTGVLFLAQVADALARVELEDEARERLDAARARREEDERAVLVAEAAVEARLGDPAVALAVLERLGTDQLEPFEVPRMVLLGALARHRAGMDATDAAGRAFAAYQAQGLLEVAPLAEPQACAVLVPVARGVGAPVPEGPVGGAVGGAEGPIDPATVDGDGELAAVLSELHGLRPREVEVLMALRTGGTNADIAEALGISPATVRKHLQRAYAGLDVRSRAEALVLLSRMQHG